MTGLGFENVTQALDGRAAVDAVTLAADPGEVLCLLGPSGCGKTTTLRLAAGLESADSGRITIGGQVMDGDNTFVAPESRNVGLVFQDFALFPHLDVRANVEFGIADQPPLPAAALPAICWNAWVCPRTARRFRTRCPVVNNSGLPWPGLWCQGQK